MKNQMKEQWKIMTYVRTGESIGSYLLDITFKRKVIYVLPILNKASCLKDTWKSGDIAPCILNLSNGRK
jgi:hypothetical protein